MNKNLKFTVCNKSLGTKAQTHLHNAQELTKGEFNKPVLNVGRSIGKMGFVKARSKVTNTREIMLHVYEDTIISVKDNEQDKKGDR